METKLLRDTPEDIRKAAAILRAGGLLDYTREGGK